MNWDLRGHRGFRTCLTDHFPSAFSNHGDSWTTPKIILGENPILLACLCGGCDAALCVCVCVCDPAQFSEQSLAIMSEPCTEVRSPPAMADGEVRVRHRHGGLRRCHPPWKGFPCSFLSWLKLCLVGMGGVDVCIWAEMCV